MQRLRRRRWFGISGKALVGLLTVMALALPAAQAGRANAATRAAKALQGCGAELYWTNSLGRSINRSNLIGNDARGILYNRYIPLGLAVVDGNLYWADQGNGTINEANRDGSDAHVIVRDQNKPFGVAANYQYLYWSNQGNGTINRSDLNGQDARAIVHNQAKPNFIALMPYSGEIYWADAAGWLGDAGNINEANPDGSDAHTIVRDQKHPFGVAVDIHHIYWSNIGRDTINMANPDGSDAHTIVWDQHAVTGVADGGGSLYWALGKSVHASGTIDPTGMVVRADLYGHSAHVIVHDQSYPRGLTVAGAFC